MHRGVKAGGDSSEAKSDISRLDTYHVISNLCHLWRLLRSLGEKDECIVCEKRIYNNTVG